MKLKTLVHRDVRRWFYRRFHFNPVVERLSNRLGRTDVVSFPEIGLTVDVNDSDVLVDCGANVGEVTSRFAATRATVYAFEPDPHAYAVLSQRFRGNRRVHCLNQGVMDRAGTLDFYLFGSNVKDGIDASVGSSFVPEKNEGNPGGVVRVQCVDLSEFIMGLGTTVKLLKMDIEGAEAKVLTRLLDTGAIDKIDHVIVETHEDQIPGLGDEIAALRARIAEQGLSGKVHLDWV